MEIKVQSSHSKWHPFDYVENHVIASFLRFRWMILHPFHQRIGRFTIGELFVLFCIVFGMTINVYYTWPEMIDKNITTLTSDGETKVITKQVMKYYVKTSGTLPEIAVILTFVSASRNSIVTFLLGIPFERALFWHKVFAWVAVLCGGWHAYLALAKRGWIWRGHYATGYIYEGSMIGMILTAFYPIRRLLFEFFYAVHLMLIIAVVVSGTLHGTYFVSIGYSLWFIDVGIRYLYLTARNPKQATLNCESRDISSLRFPRGRLKFAAGQYLFVCIPSISMFQWHPISISSSPEDEITTLHIRASGTWSQEVHKLATAATLGDTNVNVLLEGPYGDPSICLWGSRYQNFLFIAGGVGITPIRSCVRRIIHQHQNMERPLGKVLIIWVVRDAEDIQALYPLPSSSLVPSCVELQIFLTSQVLEEGVVEFGSKNTLYGRPNIKNLVKAFHESITHNDPIAVFACGPVSLIDASRHACGFCGSSFDFHSEVFEF